jgi:hypothetical protein
MYLPLSHNTLLQFPCVSILKPTVVSRSSSQYIHTHTHICTRVCTCMYKHIGFYQLQINLSEFRDLEIGSTLTGIRFLQM